MQLVMKVTNIREAMLTRRFEKLVMNNIFFKETIQKEFQEKYKLK